MSHHPPVYVVDGSRTPFLKATGKPGPFTSADLLVATGKQLLARQPFSPDLLSEVIIGSVLPSPDEVNIARVASQRLGCGHKVPAWTVQRNCGSGMQALETAVDRIRDGHSNFILAGGVDAMSHAPVLFNDEMIGWLADLNKARGPLAKLRQLSQLRPRHLRPVFGILRGLTDPVVNLNMGQTVENLADMFHVQREEMDQYALRSHQRLAAAYDQKKMTEVTPIYDRNGHAYTEDNGLRRDSTIEKLSRLRPVFDPRFGRITAGNGAQITDGAALLLLANEEIVNQYQLPVLGTIVDTHWAGLPPEHMGLGPVHSTIPLLARNQLQLSDIDYWEINEAFAAQVIACLRAFADPVYCKQHFDLETPLGSIPEERINIDGGAISLGHPVGCSGARIVLHLLNTLQQKKAQIGLATLCIGGGQGGAMLLKRG
ncbi:acetyl-CoA C-acetyltransferase [Desulfogranum marinum]|uniref:acetyl-CoA C-acetyltransferase n=1 Tax=Desulfogranum marinum TaxID=453220 RepID=UPI0029C840D3|nr:acetyl-CoA C-acetyltransferase [Desulfogranum marinum]